jgi:hypothetical protein
VCRGPGALWLPVWRVGVTCCRNPVTALVSSLSGKAKQSKAKASRPRAATFPGHLSTSNITSTTTASLTPPPAICLPPATDDEQRRPSLRTRKGLGLSCFASLFCLCSLRSAPTSHRVHACHLSARLVSLAHTQLCHAQDPELHRPGSPWLGEDDALDGLRHVAASSTGQHVRHAATAQTTHARQLDAWRLNEPQPEHAGRPPRQHLLQRALQLESARPGQGRCALQQLGCVPEMDTP